MKHYKLLLLNSLYTVECYEKIRSFIVHPNTIIIITLLISH